MTKTDTNTLDPLLWPANAIRTPSGYLAIAGHSVQDLITTYGSPLYVMDEADFRARARRFKSAFPGWDIYYAGKAFLCKAAARWVNEEGLSLDVCSGNELAVALAAGFPPARMGLHGNNKSDDELRQAIAAGVGRIIVDSLGEIDRIDALAAGYDPVPVLVRLTTGVAAHTHDYVATAVEDQKFGFSTHSGAAMEALLACHQRRHIALEGVHSHIGSQIFGTEAFEEAVRRTFAVVAQLRDRTGLQLAQVDLGGGFGIAYTGDDDPATPEELHAGMFAAAEQERIRHNLAPVRLSIEPGRAITGPAGVALYTVGTVKPVQVTPSLTRTYVSVDGGMSDNVRTALYEAQYTAVLANRRSDAEPVLSRVVGKHCESGDILVRDVYLPGDVRRGDILAVPASGAYARSLSSNYNHAARPAVIAVNDQGTYPIVRRETLDDLLALDVG